MATVTLVPWQTYEVAAGGSAWGYNGAVASSLRAAGDGNNAGLGLFGGAPDSNPLRSYQWRLPGGAPFSWLAKTITSVHVRAYVSNQSTISGSAFWAFYVANEPLTFADEVFNGELASAMGVWQWVTLVNGPHDAIKAALLADNFLFSAILYNHSLPEVAANIDAAQIIVTYTDHAPYGTMFMEA